MIKLIASDIDGTLLPEGTDRINPEIFEVIRKLKEKGIIFAAASGRHYFSMSYLFEPVKNDIIFITENGGYVNCRGNDMLVQGLEWDTVTQLVQQIRQVPGAGFTLDTKEGFVVESKDPVFLELLTHGYHNKLIQVEDALAEECKVIKVAIFKEQGIEDVRDQFVPIWGTRLNCTIAGDIWLDFMNRETNKGNAIRSIQRILSISPDETMVFGDNYNDLEMIRSATESYAVGNAQEAVKREAKFIADTNVNDGVLKVLKTLL